jgi:hypothetical protein
MQAPPLTSLLDMVASAGWPDGIVVITGRHECSYSIMCIADTSMNGHAAVAIKEAGDGCNGRR